MGDNINAADPVSACLLGESAQFGDMLPSYKDVLMYYRKSDDDLAILLPLEITGVVSLQELYCQYTL